MFTAPTEPTDVEVAESLSAGWGLDVRCDYLPAGFGSHHWTAIRGTERWFVTVDLPRTASDRDDLIAALSTAATLARDGFDRLIAPIPDRTGRPAMTRRTGSGAGFVVSLFPYVPAPRLADSAHPDHGAVVELLIELHAHTPTVVDIAGREDRTLPHRATLLACLRRSDEPWNSGPYGHRAAAAVRPHRDALDRLITRHDTLAASDQPSQIVITHGEPHDHNVLVHDQHPVLIDWDTARLAGPARDLWMVKEPELIAAYTSVTGRSISPDELLRQRLRWDLSEIGQYLGEFAAPHEETEDTAVAFGGLLDSLRIVDLAD